MAKMRRFEVVVTSDAVLTATYRIEAVTAEEALKIAVSGDVGAIGEDEIERHDRYAEVDGVEMDLPR